MSDDAPEIDQTILIAAKSLAEEISGLFANFPRYTLDFTWPTLATLDLLTTSTSLREELSENDSALLFKVSSYLAAMAFHVWNEFPDSNNVSIELEEEMVFIRHKGKGERFEVNISAAVNTLVRARPNPLPVFSTSSKYTAPGENVFSLFGIGLLSGLCPYGEGSWKDREPKDHSGALAETQEILSQSTAKYYRDIHPLETLGASASLYSNQLILPSSTHDQQYPATLATLGLHRALSAESISEEERKTTAYNLARFGDELISSAGFVNSILYCDTELTSDLIALATSFGLRAVMLRPALLTLKQSNEIPPSWIELLQAKDISKAKSLYSAERQLCLMPLCLIPDELLEEEALIPLFSALAWTDTETTLKEMKRLRSQGIWSAELSLQTAFTYCYQKKFEKAESFLQQDIDTFSVISKQIEGQRFFLLGMLAKEAGETEEATLLYQSALELTPDENPSLIRRIQEALIDCLLANKKFKEAHAFACDILESDPLNWRALRRKAEIALTQNLQDSSIEDSLLTLHRLTPFNRAVFQLLLAGAEKGLVSSIALSSKS